MIDWERVVELRDEIGADDFDEIVEVFLEEMETALGALGDGSASLEEQLHFLKGSALNLGFARFAESCQEGETRAATDDTAVDCGALKGLYETAREVFLRGLRENTAA